MSALVRKELREHGLVLGGAFLLAGLGLLGISVQAAEEGSPLVALRRWTAVFGVLLPLIVNGRLVVREYASRTQLFLETLPVTRLRVVGVKLLLGLALVAAAELAALAFCAWRASLSEPLALRHLALVGARGLAFVLAFHCLAFLAAMLGRWRAALWVGLLLTWFTLDHYGKIGITTLPLFRLLDDAMPFERVRIPWADLAAAGLFAAACLGAAFALALVREGALATALARRMSSREKVFFASLVLLYLFGLAQLEDRRVRPRFQLAETRQLAEGATVVAVGAGEGLAPERAEALGRRVARDLEELRGLLGLEEVPAVFLLPSRGLDREVFLRARLDHSDGVVVQAALAHPELDEGGLRAFVLAEVLDWHSRGRTGREDRRWLRDGLVRSLIDRAAPEAQRATRARALAAAPDGLGEADLRGWLSTRERLGPCLADALAAQALHTLGEQAGPERLQALLREALGTRPGKSAWAALTERPSSELVREVHPDGLAGLAQDLSRALARQRAALAPEAEAALRPGPAVALEPVAVDARLYEIRHAPGPGPGAPSSYVVVYRLLGPWDGELDPEGLARVEARGAGVLPLTVLSGERLFAAVEVFDPALGCTRRLAARRWEAP